MEEDPQIVSLHHIRPGMFEQAVLVLEPTTLRAGPQLIRTRCPLLFQDIALIILHPILLVCLVIDPRIYPLLLTTPLPNTVVLTIATVVVGAHLQYPIDTLPLHIINHLLLILQELPLQALIDLIEIIDR